MLILGIDPGLETTWFWVIEVNNQDISPVDFGIIKTSSKEHFWIRLLQIQNDLAELLDEFKPDLVSIEKLYFWTNITNAISVAHARWVMVVEVQKRWIEFMEFSPNEVKSMVCWYWKAEKNQVMHMVCEHLALDYKPKPDDAADALALAICWAFNS